MRRCNCTAAGVPLFYCARCGAPGITTPQDYASAIHKDLTVRGGADCAECEGSGELKRREDGAPHECWYCDGTGKEPE